MNRSVLESGMTSAWLGRTFCGGLVVAMIASHVIGAEESKPSQLVGVSEAQEPDASSADASALRLAAIEPTVLFIEERGVLLQMVNVVVENTLEPTEASLDVKVGSESSSTTLGRVKKGQTTFQVHVPDIGAPTPAEFILKTQGTVRSRRRMTWQPQRHWEVYWVPIAHHDWGYTDTIENVLLSYDSFYDDILRFCEETDDWPEESKFRYVVEATWSIQHFVENRSEEVLAKLAKYIREGRIEIPALFGNEISALCSHEELIRLMYPSFRFKREYGAQIRTASITDVPGLSWGLPTVLAGAGVKYFFAGLPTDFEWGRDDIHTFWDESAILRRGRPDAFRWQGPDGETVLVYYQGSYGCWLPRSYQSVLDALPGMLNEMEAKGSPFSVVRYGSFGCGDNKPADIRSSSVAREWNRTWAYPKLIVATHAMFFEALEKQCHDVRVFRGELPHTDYVVGAASSAKETGINRITHDRLHAAEKFATIATLFRNHPYPADPIRDAYDQLLLYDEHTWGMAHPFGKVQDWNWSDKSRCAYKAAALAESILHRSCARIAIEPTWSTQIELQKEGLYLVVFNSLSFERTDLVRVAQFAGEGSFELIDEETGHKVPYQVVAQDGAAHAPVPNADRGYDGRQPWRTEASELVFVAEDLPPLGYKTFRILPKQETDRFPSGLSVGDTTLENRFFKVSLNARTGTVESIYDKELSREIVDKDAPHQVNQFITRWVRSGKQESPKEATIRRGQIGPVYGSIQVDTEGAGCPRITQEIILYDGIKRIDFANRILKDSTALLEMYFAFPFSIDNPDFRFEGSNSVIKPFRDQLPGSNTNYYAVQHWAHVTDGQVGVTLSPIESHLLEFGGLWPCYVSQAHHAVTPPDYGSDFIRPDQVTKGHMYAFVLDSNFRTNFQPVQEGEMLFRYSITTHDGDWEQGRPRDFGWAIGNPPVALYVHGEKERTFGKTMSFCQVDEPNVLLLTLKQAEDGHGTIVRLIETEGKEVTAHVTLPHSTITKAYRTNLAEENQAELAFSPHGITAPVKGFGITTIRLETRR